MKKIIIGILGLFAIIAVCVFSCVYILKLHLQINHLKDQSKKPQTSRYCLYYADVTEFFNDNAQNVKSLFLLDTVDGSVHRFRFSHKETEQNLFDTKGFEYYPKGYTQQDISQVWCKEEDGTFIPAKEFFEKMKKDIEQTKKGNEQQAK